MKFLRNILCAVVLFGMSHFYGAMAVDLVGAVSVNQTSDTAADAKIKSMNIARRQILFNVLSKYSSPDALGDLLKETSADELVNLIESVAVSNEQISADTYSANITMNIDNVAAKRWLDEHNVKNWIPEKNSGEKFSLFIVVQNGIVDWAELKRIARMDNIDIETQSLSGNQIVAKMPLNYRSKFTSALHDAGWKFVDNGGVLQVWK